MSFGKVSEVVTETTTDRICRAITEKKIIKFYYHGTERVVEPYICGINRLNRPVLLGYQTEERDFSIRNWGWRLFELAEISYLGVTRNEFNISRTTLNSFNSLDVNMKEIYCSIARAMEPVVERVYPGRRVA